MLQESSNIGPNAINDTEGIDQASVLEPAVLSEVESEVLSITEQMRSDFDSKILKNPKMINEISSETGVQVAKKVAPGQSAEKQAVVAIYISRLIKGALMKFESSKPAMD